MTIEADYEAYCPDCGLRIEHCDCLDPSWGYDFFGDEEDSETESQNG